MLQSFFEERLIVKVGDITDEAVDAIVNAANWTLMGGGGVDGAIHRRGGPAIKDECRRIRDTTHPDGLPSGEAVITTGGLLPARFVIHTVGPIYGQHAGRESDLLAACYKNSLALAVSMGLTSISFPSISTGAYGYPKQDAAAIVYRTIEEMLEQYPQLRVTLVFFSEKDAASFLRDCH